MMTFLFTNWKALVGFIVGALLCFPLAQCHGEKLGHQQMQHAIDEANTKALAAQQRADATAAMQRLTDTIAVSHQEQELRNAIASTPDTSPDTVRIALGCERLRHAGHSSDLPSVCRPHSGVQAGATP